MALALSKAAPLQPETKLAQALIEYEIILTHEERTQLRAEGVPDATAAINLATRIDRDCNERRSRCMGPRLITVLESIQQFSTTVDTIISSHPEYAALVWGGVKLALLVANNVSSYFNKLSALFMKLGKICPRFSEFAHLYPSSTRLQRALCDYYAAIIRLCKYSTQSCRKPVYTRLSAAVFSPFETDFGPFESELEALHAEVREEISLASKQTQRLENKLQAREREEARMERKFLAKFRDKVHKDDEDAKQWRVERIQQRLEEHRRRVLDALSTYDYQKSYRQLRKECIPGTSTWVCETSEFQSWIAGSMKTLWCTGKRSGKSIISACVIAHLVESVSPQDITSFFFCRYDIETSLKAESIIGSIARQLANTLPASAFRGFEYDNIFPTAVINFLETALDSSRRYFIVLDGLDECEEAQIKDVTEFFHRLLESPLLQIKIYCSGRPIVAGWLPLGFRPQQHIVLETPENQDSISRDIRNFINVTLEELLEGETPKFEISDPTLILTILDRLQEGAHGMFLWVKFQLKTLCEKNSDHQIIEALDDLPRDLPQTFERILHGFVQNNDIEIGRQIFRWIAVAKRPLTVEELREAIGIEPLQKKWDDGRFVNNMKKAVACCGNLVFIEEEDQTIHFTHSSVKQYLLSPRVNESLRHYHIDLQEADANAGAVSVTYLSFPIFTTLAARTANISDKITSIPSMTLKRSLPSGNAANRIALALLRRHSKSSKSVSRLLEEASGDTEDHRQQSIVKQYPFRHYAEQFWFEHTKTLIDSSTELWRLWCKLFKGASWRDDLSGTSWTFEDWNQRPTDVVEWILEQNHCSLAQLFVSTEMKLTTQKLGFLFVGAAARGHTVIVNISLRLENFPQIIVDLALLSAAGGGHVDLVEILLQAGAKVNVAVDEFYDRTAFLAPAHNFHLAAVKRLLQARIEINVAISKYDDRTALQAANEDDHPNVAQRLLEAEFEVSSALQAATESGCVYVVRRLVQAGIEVDVAVDEYQNMIALRFAAEHDSLNDFPVRKHRDRTALQAATEDDLLIIVKRLLQAETQVNAAISNYDRETKTKDAHLTIVKRLRYAGAKQ